MCTVLSRHVTQSQTRACTMLSCHVCHTRLQRLSQTHLDTHPLPHSHSHSNPDTKGAHHHCTHGCRRCSVKGHGKSFTVHLPSDRDGASCMLLSFALSPATQGSPWTCHMVCNLQLHVPQRSPRPGHQPLEPLQAELGLGPYSPLRRTQRCDLSSWLWRWGKTVTAKPWTH